MSASVELGGGEAVMSEHQEARTQREALHDVARRAPTQKSLKVDAAIRHLLAAAAVNKPADEEGAKKEHGDAGKNEK
jgi:hypothetical protein